MTLDRLHGPKELILHRLAQKAIHRLRNPWIEIRRDPIIVLGNQKSGTSAIASLLADFGGLSKTIDIPPLWGRKGARIMRGEQRFADTVLRNKRYFASELIKEPFMTFFSDQVIEVFPDARFVMIIRDPRENIRSLLNSRGLPTNTMEVDKSLFAEVKSRYPAILDPDIWGGDGEDYISILASRWNKAADTYLARPDSMILVRYEDFILDKYALIRSVAQNLGVDEKDDISAKLDIQYQPRGLSNRRWLEVFGEQNLATIDQICGDRLLEFGYTLSDTD